MRTVKLLIISFALLVVLGCGSPYRIATIGAKVYHRPGCKYAEQSFKKYGDEKRLEYFEPLTIALSGRKACPKCSP